LPHTPFWPLPAPTTQAFRQRSQHADSPKSLAAKKKRTIIPLTVRMKKLRDILCHNMPTADFVNAFFLAIFPGDPRIIPTRELAESPRWQGEASMIQQWPWFSSGWSRSWTPSRPGNLYCACISSSTHQAGIVLYRGPATSHFSARRAPILP
jgi:hypothetical protein